MSKIYVITGANKGIGYGIVRGLVRQLEGEIIYLTARNADLGQEALKKLALQLGPEQFAKNQLLFHQLDIVSLASCQKFAKYLAHEHGGLDVLVNNAGIAFPNDATESPGEQANVTIGVNYYGTKQLCEQLIPLIRVGGRIVNICSQMGIMADAYKKELVERFSRPNYTIADIDNFVEDYKRLAHQNLRKQGGYPESAYRVSKAAEIALTMFYARELNSKGILVNACCPGYVDTDMSNHKGHLTVDQGADTPIWLATSPDAPHGQFVYKRMAKSWLIGAKIDFS